MVYTVYTQTQRAPDQRVPVHTQCPAYHLVSILGTVFYQRNSMKYIWDALTHMTVHQIIGTQLRKPAGG